jgi:hypothetical protein
MRCENWTTEQTAQDSAAWPYRESEEWNERVAGRYRPVEIKDGEIHLVLTI